MQSSANLKVRTHHQQSEWELSSSLWKSPSSPPYTQAQSSTPFSSSNQKTGDSHASSPSTPSEFEFDSICSLRIRDDPPASPKLISSSTSEYWSTFGARRTTGGAEIASLGTARTTSGAEVSLIGVGRTTPATIINHKVAPLSHPITSTKQSSTPPASPSVRQLMAEEMVGDHEDDDGLALDFYSAPQTPTPPRKSSKQRVLSQDHEPTFSIVGQYGGQRKSKSVVLERRAPFELAPLATQKNQLLQSSKSESHEYFFSSSSTVGWEKNEEDKEAGVLKKQGSSSKSFKKWAFKDILRRTVPSSKAEAHYRTRVLGATSSKNHLSSRESTPIMSPTASPSRSHMHQHINSTSMSTLEAGRLPSTPPTQSPHRRTSMPTSSPGRTPAPSPPRSPMSPHAAHYQRQKAQSQDLSRKTFLPYRQSLLGCLGGPSAFPLEQHVW